jgi:DNA-binding HxlR family transcriptional regulator
MLKHDYEGQNCSIAGALEVVGERWTLLIVRDAFLGLHRFDEFRESLGIARNVLTDRLNKLVEEGIFEREPYGDRADRFDYRLTQKGLDLHVALVGLRQWGDRYMCDKPPTVARRRSDKKRLLAALVPAGTKTVPVHEAEFVAGPGRDPSASTWRVLGRRS